MLTGQALDIVIRMAKERCSKHGQSVTTTELEAIEETEFLLSSFDDSGDYTEDDYLND